MKTSPTDNLPKFAILIFTALVIAAVLLRFFTPSEPISVPTMAACPPSKERPSPAAAVELRETFAGRMPSGRGVAVVAGSGEYNASHVLVAVPDAFQHLQYLPGSDPRAVKYLSETRAAQEHATNIDDTPRDADISSVSVGRDALSSQAKQIGVSADHR